MTRPAGNISLVYPESVVLSFLRLGPDRAGIPVPQESSFMGIMTTITRYTAIFVQGNETGGPLGGFHICEKLLQRQTHLILYLVCGHVRGHFRRRGRIHVWITGGVAGRHGMTISTQVDRLAAQSVYSRLFDIGTDLGHAQVAPETRVGFSSAGIELVVHVERLVACLYVAVETKSQRVWRGRSTEEIAVRHGGRLFFRAAPFYIMASGTGELSLLKRKIGRYRPCHSGAGRQIQGMDFTRCLPPVMTRLT
jgi:hypothetical protein